MLHFQKLIRREILFKLYKAYILPQFYYCSSVWHFCRARDSDKLEALNKRILRFILGDYSSPYNTLLSKVNSISLWKKRVQNFLILLLLLNKSLFFTYFPGYMKNMFSLRSSSYDLRGNYILSLSKPKTTTYRLNSLSYFSAKQWNALPDFFVLVFLQTLRPKYRMLPPCRFFLLDILKLKISFLSCAY